MYYALQKEKWSWDANEITGAKESNQGIKWLMRYFNKNQISCIYKLGIQIMMIQIYSNLLYIPFSIS